MNLSETPRKKSETNTFLPHSWHEKKSVAKKMISRGLFYAQQTNEHIQNISHQSPEKAVKFQSLDLKKNHSYVTNFRFNMPAFEEPKLVLIVSQIRFQNKQIACIKRNKRQLRTLYRKVLFAISQTCNLNRKFKIF